MKQYLSTTEVAKMIRQVLKEAFPSIKFSVKSSKYSGGSSITASYTDGPSADQVEALIKTFQGRYFDGMTDYEGLRYQALDGVETMFGVSYVFVRREKSAAFMESVVAAVSARYGFGDTVKVVTTAYGSYVDRVTPTEDMLKRGFGQLDVERIVQQAISETSLTVPLPSPTAARVTYLGDDGYGYGATGRIQPEAA